MDRKDEDEKSGWICRITAFFGVLIYDYFALQTYCH